MWSRKANKRLTVHFHGCFAAWLRVCLFSWASIGVPSLVLTYYLLVCSSVHIMYIGVPVTLLSTKAPGETQSKNINVLHLAVF